MRLRADLPDRAPAYAIAGALEQLVDNLIDNALAASPAGTEIVVSVQPAPGSITLHVVDEGPGLDPDDIDRAFDRFWRGPNAAAGGSGLGLAIVRRLAEASRDGAVAIVCSRWNRRDGRVADVAGRCRLAAVQAPPVVCPFERDDRERD